MTVGKALSKAERGIDAKAERPSRAPTRALFMETHRSVFGPFDPLSGAVGKLKLSYS
jgi:hypothetical protein